MVKFLEFHSVAEESLRLCTSLSAYALALRNVKTLPGSSLASLVASSLLYCVVLIRWNLFMKRYRPSTSYGSVSIWSSAESYLTKLFLPSTVVQYMTRCSLTTPASINFCMVDFAFRWSSAPSAETCVIKNILYLFLIRLINSKTFGFVSKELSPSA